MIEYIYRCGAIFEVESLQPYYPPTIRCPECLKWQMKLNVPGNLNSNSLDNAMTHDLTGKK